jgi:hypothetical protein
MKRKRTPSTNDIIHIFWRRKNRPKLRVRKLDRNTVLIEGTSAAFEFLGRFLLAHSQEEDCKTWISPKGAGSVWFTKDSKLGLYLHRLPCTLNPHAKMRVP